MFELNQLKYSVLFWLCTTRHIQALTLIGIQSSVIKVEDGGRGGRLNEPLKLNYAHKFE